jgi:hypothetical protein
MRHVISPVFQRAIARAFEASQQRRFSIRIPVPSSPRVRVPTHVKYRDHGNEVRFHGEVHGIRKDANNRSANAFLNYRKLKGIIDESN